MKTIGLILLWLGFIAGSLSTVMHSEAKGVKFVKGLTTADAEASRYEYVDLSGIEVPEDGWHLIPWSWYVPAALVCVIGATMIQISSRSTGQKSDKTQGSLSEINAALDQAIAATKKLQKDVPGLAPSKIASRIDDEIAEALRIFADGRECIIAEFGLNCFADVMTNFAAGERSINRAWSAAADGYVDEAATCIERGIKLFQEAQSDLSQAHDSTGE